MKPGAGVARGPDCVLCSHFYVTWERSHSRGCRAYGFKSDEYPSAVVLRESGAPCQLFAQRPAPRDDERGAAGGDRRAGL